MNNVSIRHHHDDAKFHLQKYKKPFTCGIYYISGFLTRNSSDESCAMRLKEFKEHFDDGVRSIVLEVHEAAQLQYKGDTSTWIGKIGVR